MTNKTSPSHMDRSSVCSGPLTMFPQCLLSLRSKEKAHRKTTQLSSKPGANPFLIYLHSHCFCSIDTLIKSGEFAHFGVLGVRGISRRGLQSKKVPKIERAFYRPTASSSRPTTENSRLDNQGHLEPRATDSTPIGELLVHFG
jgi:hypothetical protein